MHFLFLVSLKYRPVFTYKFSDLIQLPLLPSSTHPSPFYVLSDGFPSIALGDLTLDLSKLCTLLETSHQRYRLYEITRFKMAEIGICRTKDRKKLSNG